MCLLEFLGVEVLCFPEIKHRPYKQGTQNEVVFTPSCSMGPLRWETENSACRSRGEHHLPIPRDSGRSRKQVRKIHDVYQENCAAESFPAQQWEGAFQRTSESIP